MPHLVTLDIAIDPSKLRLTSSDVPTDFVMGPDAITVTVAGSSIPGLSIDAATGGLTLPLNSVSAADPMITLQFHVHDAGQTWPNFSYGLQGIIYKLDATSAAGTPTSMPTRFSNIRGTGGVELEIDYDLNTSGLQYEYYLIVQNLVSGAWGLIDPRITTVP